MSPTKHPITPTNEQIKAAYDEAGGPDLHPDREPHPGDHMAETIIGLILMMVIVAIVTHCS